MRPPGVGFSCTGKALMGCLGKAPRLLQHHTRTLACRYAEALSSPQEASMGFCTYQGAGEPGVLAALAQDVHDTDICPLIF